MIPTNLIPKVIGYNLFRTIGKPKIHPFNLTLSVTGKCNSKCKTCQIWKHTNQEDMDLKEWSKILKDIGDSPIWITISGGEPFLRDDLVELFKIITKFNKPQIITIATNGILTDKIYSDINKILSFYKGELIVNISIDCVNSKYDEIRGVKCFNEVMKTYNQLSSIKNLSVGLHTVISKFNINYINEIRDLIIKLNPDSYIFQIAENRTELQNISSKIVPKTNEYLQAVNNLNKIPKTIKNISKTTQFLRKKYHKNTKNVLLNSKGIACYAGIASAHINYNGELWACCVKCQSFDNLKDNSFKELWQSKKAKEIRNQIKSNKCHCTLANVSYSNIICDPLCVFL